MSRTWPPIPPCQGSGAALTGARARWSGAPAVATAPPASSRQRARPRPRAHRGRPRPVRRRPRRRRQHRHRHRRTTRRHRRGRCPRRSRRSRPGRPRSRPGPPARGARAGRGDQAQPLRGVEGDLVGRRPLLRSSGRLGRLVHRRAQQHHSRRELPVLGQPRGGHCGEVEAPDPVVVPRAEGLAEAAVIAGPGPPGPFGLGPEDLGHGAGDDARPGCVRTAGRVRGLTQGEPEVLHLAAAGALHPELIAAIRSDSPATCATG